MTEEEIKKQMEAERPDMVEVPEFLQGDKWFGEDVQPYRLDFTKPYKPPKYTLSWNGIGFAPIGGIHAVTGQAGNGKTMTLAQFISAILGGSFGNLRYELSEEIPEPRVLYIDTEMEEANTIAMKNRVLSMTGRVVGENYDDFVVIMLREANSKDKDVSAAVMRWRLTLKALYEYRPTVAFIDGLLDVVNDFNSNTECQEIIYKCMQAATHYGISLWCLVHQNPGADKLVGHIGSMLERKVTDIFVTKKEKNDITGDVTFNVHQMKARGRDVPDWKFKVMPVGGWGMPEQLNAEPKLNDIPENIKRWLEIGRNYIEWPASKEKIREIIKNRGGVANRAAQLDNIRVAMNRRFIIEQPAETRTKGQTHIKYILNPEEFKDEDPFGPQREDAPF
jgi:KaiC/GvpD/RAD55 family RecA-like ATPase